MLDPNTFRGGVELSISGRELSRLPSIGTAF